MKILHLETGRHLYGGPLQVLYLLEGLKKTGVDNILVCPRGSEVGREARSMACVCEVPVAGDMDARLLFALRRILKKHRPDLLHVHSRRGADLWGGLAARFGGTPAVISRRVDNPERPWLARRKYALYEKVITISEGISRVLRSEGIGEEKLSCIRDAVKSKAFQEPRDRRWFQSEFGYGLSDPVIGVIAQLIPRKGHRFLLDAAPSIIERYPHVQFLFLGEGPLRNELIRDCQQKGLVNKISFAGFRDDLARILPCLDIVAHPATMEGLGVSLLQTSSAGVPIVASAVGGIPEIVLNGKNGLLVEPRSAPALADSILKLLGDPELRQEMGRQGKQIIEEKFSIDRMVNQHVKVYSQTIEGHRANP